MKKIKYLIVPLMICGLVVTGCGKKKQNENPTTTTTVTPQAKIEMNVEEKDNILYVNGNKVEFDAKAAGFDENEKTLVIYYILEDVVYAHYYEAVVGGGKEANYFVDSKGKIIQTIGDENGDIVLSNNGKNHLRVTNTDPNNHVIEGNTIYFKIITDDTAIVSQDSAYCMAKNRNELDNIVSYVDKVTYLGNGKFSVEKAIETTTFDEMGKEYFQSMWGTEPNCNFEY